MLYEVITSSRGISFDINPEEKTDEKTAKEFSENYGYKPTFYARGEFADFEEKFGEGIGGIVITSYSIHYTKLYDGRFAMWLLNKNRAILDLEFKSFKK